jgi:hypothetical protein
MRLIFGGRSRRLEVWCCSQEALEAVVFVVAALHSIATVGIAHPVADLFYWAATSAKTGRKSCGREDNMLSESRRVVGDKK